MHPEPKCHPFQEALARQPWRMLVGCICCHRAHGKDVKAILPSLFMCYPTLKDLAGADVEFLARILRPLGFQNRRARTLVAFANAALAGTPLDKCPGIGRYGRDSYAIFVEGRTDVRPWDHVLRKYLEERR